MKVLMINGSPRVGGNTATALAEMEKVFQQEGIETEIVRVGSKEIRGCISCRYCFEHHKCVFDDIVNELAVKFEECDGLVVGSPVFYAGPNGTPQPKISFSPTHSLKSAIASHIISPRLLPFLGTIQAV